jgi:hypothetical protein
MEAARRCGLAPSQCWLSSDLRTFITERFDVVDGKRLGISTSPEVGIVVGLKDSILSSVHCATSDKYSTKAYIHDKKKKFE